MLNMAVSCISFDSYIKPQRAAQANLQTVVVYLLIPTSNHNECVLRGWRQLVVYLLIPTSNHNLAVVDKGFCWVVYLLIPTSNHNLQI